MRLPIRKPGQHTFQKSDPHITLDKFNELKNKLERLKKISQPKAIAEVKRLALDGDFSENAAYQIAKGRLRGINQCILEIEEHLKRVEIIKTPSNNERVQLGHHVTIESNGKIKTYLLLGSTETDPMAGVISHHSPLGSALLGHRIGDRIQIKLAMKDVEYKIVNIE
jgi:transcription elongation factor GreA